MSSHRFDVFLCHNRQDKPAVRKIGQKLRDRGLKPWLDEWELQPGLPWQTALEAQISEIASAAVFVGPDGIGPWQEQEINAFLRAFVKRKCPVIPVILSECIEPPALPVFLEGMTWVDFREPDPMERLVWGITGKRGKPRPSNSHRVWTVPYRRNPYFVGREEILEQLRERLTQDGAAALGQTQAISGLGGIGKTQTAVEYAYRYRHEYKAVLFVRADTEAEILTGYSELARELGLGEAQEQEDVVASLLAWLKGNDGWLLILDNADTPQMVKPFLPADRRGHVLLTSRARMFHSLGIRKPFRMPTLPLNEAVELLLERAEREETDLGESERIACEQLARELGCLPLALEQAGAFILEMDSRFADYLQSYRKRGLELLGLGKPQVEGHPEPVARTWSLNFREVEESSPPSAEVLRASAFLSPDDIPLEILRQGGSELGPILAEILAETPEDGLVVDKVLEPLTRYSLIQREISNQTYSVHRLVQAVMIESMEPPDRQLFAARSVRALNQTFPNPEFRNWPICDRLLPHALRAHRIAIRYSLTTIEAARLHHKTGHYLDDRARYSEAEPLYQRSLEITEKALGKDHPEVATTLNNLGILYRAQGRYEEAEPLYQRSLEIKEKALGKDHPHVLQALRNYAAFLRATDREDEAAELEARAGSSDDGR